MAYFIATCRHYNNKTPLDVLYFLRVLIHNNVVYYTTNYNAQCVKHNKTYLLSYIIIDFNSFYCNDIVRTVYLRDARQSCFVRLLLFTSRAHNDIIIERYECRTEYERTRNITIICFHHYHTYYYCNIILCVLYTCGYISSKRYNMC